MDEDSGELKNEDEIRHFDEKDIQAKYFKIRNLVSSKNVSGAGIRYDRSLFHFVSNYIVCVYNAL